MPPRTDREALEVHLDATELGPAAQVGVLRHDRIRTDLPASFEYDPAWLAGRRAFVLDPRLQLWGGEQYPPRHGAAFGVFLDSAPDRWGRLLMERREAARAARERRPIRELQEVDFLLGVHDLTRSGALRFRSAGGGPFLDDSADAAPPFASLRELARLSQRVEEPGVERLPEYERWLAVLVAPGSSLGGARPKASFTDVDGSLWIAKFPSRGDRHDVGAWEYVVHRLARRAGIEVPAARLESLTPRYSTFCVQRFDRARARRRMFASAMTLLERRDGEGGSYLDLAQLIASEGAAGQIDADLLQLFRRAAFNVLVANRDDHLRNHGFVRELTGWRLSPAYDMNPNPGKPEHALALDERSAAPDLGALIATAELYRLDEARARQVIDEVREGAGRWRAEAKRAGLPSGEIARMAGAFAA